MTLDEFKHKFEHSRKLIACRTVEQRRVVLQFLVDVGYVLGSNTQLRLTGSPEQQLDFRYPNISYDGAPEYDVSSRNNLALHGNPHFTFEELEPLINGYEDVKTPSVSLPEFSDNLQTLFS